MRALIYLLIFGLTPGAAEMVVDAGHLLLNGHSAHSAVAVDGDSDDAHASDVPDGHHSHEHSCSAMFHVCGCHGPAPTTAALRLCLSGTRWSELPEESVAIIGSLLPPADGTATNNIRPPIA